MTEGRIVVGLGNPGTAYARTRHNVGFRVLDRLVRQADLVWTSWHGLARAAQWGASGLLLKPATFMNLSGRVLEDADRLGGVPPGNCLVVVDDVALALGVLRIRRGGSHGGHNGLRDIERALGTDEFPRLRLGVGSPAAGVTGLVDWVLADFEASEEPRVLAMVECAAIAVRGFLDGEDVGRLMARFNGAVDSAQDSRSPVEE